MAEPAAHHVGITVSDLDRAVAFYRDVLGLDVLTRFSVGGDAFARGVDVDGASADFAHLDGGGVRIELVAYEPTDETQAESEIHLNAQGATHVGLSVDDVAEFYAELPERVETLSEPQTTESGTTIFFLEDPEGNLIEILST
ncbi:VOC family protein [Halobellus sp. H-GB7]|uniref:VOC family protein n=1 Tax=Halobellus sp. H-GB7 TaxID=3069756 RepID=UPI0027B2B5B7|nr:VOC family protein [Halobellus sp. H-GB7]MDQ2056220.1 VOC family protein [Halobellus sp. H-GB7]